MAFRIKMVSEKSVSANKSFTKAGWGHVPRLSIMPLIVFYTVDQHVSNTLMFVRTVTFYFIYIVDKKTDLVTIRRITLEYSHDRTVDIIRLKIGGEVLVLLERQPIRFLSTVSNFLSLFYSIKRK